MNQTQKVKSDYISHHLPVKSQIDTFTDNKNNDVNKLSSGNKQRKYSRGMTFSRKLGAGFIIMGHFFSIFSLYDFLFMDLNTSLRWIAAIMVLYVITGTVGITAGAHRLWAHRTYKANLPARVIIAICNCFANQSSILHWAVEHRVHHRHVDTEADPHNINQGFFYAHMGWLFAPRSDEFAAARKRIDASDLLSDPVVYYQDKYYMLLGPFFCYIFPAILGYYFAGSAWKGFIHLGCLRWIITLHVTWCVNSVAHTHGPRPYDPNQKASEFGLVSLFTGGEGWHNFHHAFPWDYAASESAPDLFWRFNLARFWIDSFAAIGWVWDRKVQRNVTRVEYDINDHQ